MREISWLAENRLAYHAGLCSMEYIVVWSIGYESRDVGTWNSFRKQIMETYIVVSVEEHRSSLSPSRTTICEGGQHSFSFSPYPNWERVLCPSAPSHFTHVHPVVITLKPVVKAWCLEVEFGIYLCTWIYGFISIQRLGDFRLGFVGLSFPWKFKFNPMRIM